MSYHSWQEQESHWLEDFICGALGGAMGFFNFPGWLLVYFGWVDMSEILILCVVAGLTFGLWQIDEGSEH